MPQNNKNRRGPSDRTNNGRTKSDHTQNDRTKSDRPKSENKRSERNMQDPNSPVNRKVKTPRKPQMQSKSTGKVTSTMRIAKAIARAGLCSRREAEAWVELGRISVNGKVLISPALNVTPEDTILVDGEALPGHQQTRLFRYHKPKGQMTTHKDPDGRPTVFENLPDDLPRVISIGRLDLNTEGLLLLTNDGSLARLIELPKTGWLRRYKVRAHGRVKQSQLDKLKNGITIDGVKYGAIEAELERQQGSNAWLTIGIREGKNREIRKVLGELDLKVNRLIRLSFGPFQLGDLKMGVVEEVNIQTLRDQLGEKTSEELGLGGTRSRAAPEPSGKTGGKPSPHRGTRTQTPDGRPKRPAQKLRPKKKIQKRRNQP